MDANVNETYIAFTFEQFVSFVENGLALEIETFRKDWLEDNWDIWELLPPPPGRVVKLMY